MQVTPVTRQQSRMQHAGKQNGKSLQYASTELQGDREIVLAAVEQDGSALQYASSQLRGDREIVLAAVKQDGSTLQYASTELQGDHEIVLAAVEQDGSALQYASTELRRAREIVLTAQKHNRWPLEYVPYELRCDREIVLAAVKQHARALRYASTKLRGDHDEIVISFRFAHCGDVRGDRVDELAGLARRSGPTPNMKCWPGDVAREQIEKLRREEDEKVKKDQGLRASCGAPPLSKIPLELPRSVAVDLARLRLGVWAKLGFAAICNEKRWCCPKCHSMVPSRADSVKHLFVCPAFPSPYLVEDLWKGGRQDVGGNGDVCA